jgi:hypothetical protein
MIATARRQTAGTLEEVKRVETILRTTSSCLIVNEPYLALEVTMS